MTNKYQVYDYDVWGNEKDGFDVNNVFKTPYVVEISEKDFDKEVIGRLKDAGFLKKTCKNSKFQIGGEPDYTLYVMYSPTWYPVCELRRFEE